MLGTQWITILSSFEETSHVGVSLIWRWGTSEQLFKINSKKKVKRSSLGNLRTYRKTKIYQEWCYCLFVLAREMTRSIEVLYGLGTQVRSSECNRIYIYILVLTLKSSPGQDHLDLLAWKCLCIPKYKQKGEMFSVLGKKTKYIYLLI